ncbi:aminodeoxychorismate lyase [Marinomonas transparens]|uniref:Aminodeoxychorismate lyase n=1 Tax=Marinomonas transparens TaxID=2795388 RepID=A0A934JXE4_9GAMM|nr:aminodeoxychorismate lyase [Marinomonas transparens]MBJ7539972.1 aminodeoxychorismate lyase [Marinomonas transparens]
MTWFVNYHLNSSISVTDRGLSYGDGVFETIRTTPSHFFQLNDHLARLYHGLDKLGMPFSIEQKSTLQCFLHENVLATVHCDSVVKIIVTRGEGGRGYAPPESALHTVIIGVSKAPNYQAQQQEGVRLSISPVPVNANPYLAGIKHLNRLENITAKRLLNDADFEAVMLFDSEVVECIQSNIFWFQNAKLFTPSLEKAGVQGTYRQALIEQQTLYPVHVGHFSLQDLKLADEVFITNSLMSVVPVTNVAGQSYPIGHHTRILQNCMLDKDLDDAS